MKKKIASTTEEVVEKFKQVNNDPLLNFSLVDYKNNKEKVCIICHHKDEFGNEHGKFWMKPNNFLNGQGCPICNSSHLEKEVKQALDSNNINYIYQDKPSWLKPLSLDFYLPDQHIAIECQGRQHYQSILFFGGIFNTLYLKFFPRFIILPFPFAILKEIVIFFFCECIWIITLLRFKEIPFFAFSCCISYNPTIVTNG